MKTVEHLNAIIQNEIASVKTLLSEIDEVMSCRNEMSQPDLGLVKIKNMCLMIEAHDDEIARLRRLICFVESTSEMGIQMMLDQLSDRYRRIISSASKYDSAEMRKEYLANAGMQLIRSQIDELEFLLK